MKMCKIIKKKDFLNNNINNNDNQMNFNSPY